MNILDGRKRLMEPNQDPRVARYLQRQHSLAQTLCNASDVVGNPYWDAPVKVRALWWCTEELMVPTDFDEGGLFYEM
jgi:hypothetical protein